MCDVLQIIGAGLGYSCPEAGPGMPTKRIQARRVKKFSERSVRLGPVKDQIATEIDEILRLMLRPLQQGFKVGDSLDQSLVQRDGRIPTEVGLGQGDIWLTLHGIVARKWLKHEF